jgi:hypothetical protein
MMRWQQTDLIGLNGGTNYYEMEGNGPEDAVDPMGLDEMPSNRQRSDAWYHWVNPFIVPKAIARLASKVDYAVSDALKSRGYNGLATAAEVAGNLNGVMESLTDNLNPLPTAVIPNTYNNVSAGINRVTMVYQASRAGGENMASSITLAGLIPAADAVGVTRIEESYMGKTLITNTPLTSADRWTSGIVGSVQLVGTAYGGAKLLCPAPAASKLWQSVSLRTNGYLGAEGEAALQGAAVNTRLRLSARVPAGRYMYAIDSEGKMWLAPIQEGIGHSSLVPANAQVRAAGNIVITQDGHVAVNSASGHYMQQRPILAADEAAWRAAMEATLREAGLKPVELHAGNQMIQLGR